MRKLWLGLLVLVLMAMLSYFLFPTIAGNREVEDKTYRIGVLISGSERMQKINGLKAGLQNLGYFEGMNVTFVIKDAKNQVSLMKKYAIELDDMDLDAIVAGGAIETRILKDDQTGQTPIAFLGVADAVQLNLVDSYREPNGRITGVENAHVELSGKRLQLFKQLLPELKRIIVVYDEKVEASLLSLENTKKVANDLSINLLPVSVSNKNQLRTLQSMNFKNDDGVIVLPSYYLENISEELGELALKQHVPIFGVNEYDLANGFLLSYGVSYYDQGYQCASMISQIINGVSPSNIPVEKPDTVKLLVNSNTEKQLDISFSQSINAFAERIDF